MFSFIGGMGLYMYMFGYVKQFPTHRYHGHLSDLT
jgi:hypothetical protein